MPFVCISANGYLPAKVEDSKSRKQQEKRRN